MIEWKTDEAVLPLIGIARERPSSGHHLQQWLLANKDQIHQLLYTYGALLFRGFGVASVEEFRGIAGIFCNEFGSYVGGNSPRTRVASHVFTSTEYPKEERISMHNEASYLKCMPGKILFFCLDPAAKGGATPLADCRPLGADRPVVLKMVISQGILLTTVGVLSGLIISYLSIMYLDKTIKLSSMLYGVKTYDVASYLVVVSTILVVTLVACWFPTRRATKIDPITSLRYE